MKYKVVEGSQSGHCCFEYTVVDTETPHEHHKGKFEQLCETFSKSEADKIVEALNANGPMKFTKEVPNRWGYYWVIDLANIEPFVAFVWSNQEYSLMIHHAAAPFKPSYAWTGEHKYLRFGDKIEKPGVECIND